MSASLECGHDFVIVCPECGGGLCAKCGECEYCGRSFLADNFIVDVLRRNDDFYEGAYDATVRFGMRDVRQLSTRILLPFVQYGYASTVFRTVPWGSKLLELGAGGGVRLFSEAYRAYAVDLSLASLKNVPDSYSGRIRADVARLELKPRTFDAVVASCFFEHFTADAKGELLAKVWRWLKPGGYVIFLFDVESANPIFRYARRDARLYREAMVEHDGHVGLESVDVNLEHFRRAGYRHVRGIGLNRTLQHLPVYIWLAPYQIHSHAFRLGARIAEVVSKNRSLNRLFTAAVHSWDLSIGRVFPESWSRLYLGVWQRPADS